MKMQGFEPRFSQNLAPVSLVKPQNPYFAYISHLFSQPYLRVRRWNQLHFEDFAQTILDVVRVDHPHYDRPLLIGTMARELTTVELRLAYSHRSPVETNFFVAQDTAGMEMPRAWTENSILRRIGLALLAGCLLKAIAAVCEPLATGPWDKKPQPTAGRLSHHLNIQ